MGLTLVVEERGTSSNLTVGQRVGVGKDQFVLGRGHDADLRIEGPGIAREHAKLVCSDGQWGVENLSRANGNGTYVDGRRVQWSVLGPAFQIGIGDVVFRVELGG